MRDYEIVEFSSQAALRAWFMDNGAAKDGIWLRIYKKGSKIPTVTYAEALDEALCFGWIDGMKKGLDEVSFLQKFTPRRPRSTWSKRNIEHIERLMAAGLMTPAGMAEVDKAKTDGRWQAAYDAFGTAEIPADFMELLQLNPAAKEFFDGLNKTNRYAIAWRLQTAKAEAVRQRRTEKIIAMLEAGQKFY